MPEHFFAGAWPACLLAAALAGCAVPAVQPAAAPVPAAAPAVAAPPAPERVAAVPAVVSPAQPHPLTLAIAFAERVRGLPAAEVAQEIQRLGERSYSPLDATQLAVALGQTRAPANQARAQSLLQRVLADPTPEAQPLQPYARLLSLQIADQRRADEQAERQAQQLRDAQRRIEQLNDRLEAVRAIERSLPGPARPQPGR